MSKKIILSFILFLGIWFGAIGQDTQTEIIDYSKPAEYIIGGITVTGVQYLDNKIIIMLSGLNVDEKIKIPGDNISDAIKKLWKQEMFESIEISYSKIEGDRIFLDVKLKEQPKLAKFSFKGVRKSEDDDLREKMGLTAGDAINNNVLIRTKNRVNAYFIDKGFLNVNTTINQKHDTASSNQVILYINIEKGSKVKISEIILAGNSSLTDAKLKSKLKETKEKKFYRLWKASKFIQKDFDADKELLVKYYNSEGYRDARIVSDSVQNVNDKLIKININVFEGQRYYFGEINWVGNTKYSNSILSSVLGITKGDVYNQEMLETRLFMDLEKGDVQSLYMNMGYLFSSVTPIESKIHGDTIDLEIRIYEGKQARVKHVTVKGNTKTHDNVILREIRTKPGQLFNRAEIIRTQRELAQLKYFDPEKLGVNPKPNPMDGTVDIEYTVEETSSDQIEMSVGWGLNRIIGTVGVSFNNFSTKNLFNKSSWDPIPSGDGQKMSLRMQSNGAYFQSYSASFTEPWLGGKKPNALTVSAYRSVQTNGLLQGDANRSAITISGISVGLGKRLQWPDDYFTLYQSVGVQNYNLQQYGGIFTFSNGNSNNFSYTVSLSRNSIDRPIYPTSGSEIEASLQLTPPYSLFNNKDYSKATDQEKFLWLEYYKWKLNFSFYTGLGKSKVASDLVLHARAKFGFLGSYNSVIGDSPFERFYLGGDGLSGFSLDGRELVGMRGYQNNSLTPSNSEGYIGGTVFSKYTLELRYPLTKNPMATVFFLGFLEAGNDWSSIRNFNPFDVHRSAGIGARIYLPMFGLLGLDWGYGFDPIDGSPGNDGSIFHFSINGSID
ncbi:MAG: outer membrane protein assembly factor BamA [Bacteroidetes bacterium CG2_30_33_31]|nr:MAG: outer membrane protein assembly factor BamA [Bacteroidetes bacterium CG2_30_33_31]